MFKFCTSYEIRGVRLPVRWSCKTGADLGSPREMINFSPGDDHSYVVAPRETIHNRRWSWLLPVRQSIDRRWSWKNVLDRRWSLHPWCWSCSFYVYQETIISHIYWTSDYLCSPGADLAHFMYTVRQSWLVLASKPHKSNNHFVPITAANKSINSNHGF